MLPWRKPTVGAVEDPELNILPKSIAHRFESMLENELTVKGERRHHLLVLW